MTKKVEVVYPHRYDGVDYNQGDTYEIKENDYQSFADYLLIKKIEEVKKPSGKK